MKQLRWMQQGDIFIWLSGSALTFVLILFMALLAVIVRNSIGIFWQQPLERFVMRDGTRYLAEIVDREAIPHFGENARELYRLKLKRGNRDLYGDDFLWIDESEIAERNLPNDAVALERLEWGNFYGYFARIVDENGDTVGDKSQVQRYVTEANAFRHAIAKLERTNIGNISDEQESLRLKKMRLVRLDKLTPDASRRLDTRIQELESAYAKEETEIAILKEKLKMKIALRDEAGEEKVIPFQQVIRYLEPNRLGVGQKSRLYLEKLWGFLWDNPRESNTEGGVFPAIFGTVLMVIIMSLVVTPLGVIAAIYLREYAKQGVFVSLVRIAVNNIAGVPSIVFGVFGLGFFVYIVGGSIDQLFFPDALPSPTFGTGGIFWASLTLALLTVPTVIVSTEEGLAAIPRELREGAYALGATKFETLWKVILPALTPSILTGMILAVARAAGEVAPLMITGVVKLAPSLPLDSSWPYLHLSRKFMHLGFHIYDVGFQSPNVEAARPMVFATTFLLLLIVFLLNISAIIFRNKLRKKLAASSV